MWRRDSCWWTPTKTNSHLKEQLISTRGGTTDLDYFVLAERFGEDVFPNFHLRHIFVYRDGNRKTPTRIMLIWVIISFHVSSEFAVFQLSQTDWPVFVVTPWVFKVGKSWISGSSRMARWRWMITNSEIMGWLRALT